MLSLIQSREYNRAQKMDNFFAKDSAIISTYAPSAEDAESFNSNFTIFQKLCTREKGKWQ